MYEEPGEEDPEWADFLRNLFKSGELFSVTWGYCQKPNCWYKRSNLELCLSAHHAKL